VEFVNKLQSKDPAPNSLKIDSAVPLLFHAKRLTYRCDEANRCLSATPRCERSESSSHSSVSLSGPKQVYKSRIGLRDDFVIWRGTPGGAGERERKKFLTQHEMQNLITYKKGCTIQNATQHCKSFTFIFIFQSYQEYHKQCVTTADAKNVPTPTPVCSKNNGSTICFRHTTHQTPILTNAEDFDTVRVGSQRPIYCIHSSGTMLRP
jgi:hypothetical protein